MASSQQSTSKKTSKKQTSSAGAGASKKKTSASKKASSSSSKKKSTKKSSGAAVSAEGVEKLRIRVRAYEHKILDASVKQIIDTALRYDAHVVGPVPLPTEVKRYTVNRSTFVFEDAREQYEMRMHKRLIDIRNPSSKVIEALTNLSLPSGVNIEVKMV